LQNINYQKFVSKVLKIYLLILLNIFNFSKFF